MNKILICVLVFPFVLGSNCSENTPVLASELEQISAGALVTCDPYLPKDELPTLQPRTCLLLANPMRPVLRVFDVSEDKYLLSPIGYSPLGVRLDGMTKQMVSFENSENNIGLVFALDSNLFGVSALNARNVGATASFSSSNALAALPSTFRPHRIHMAPDALGNPQLLTTFEDVASLWLTPYDASILSYGTPQVLPEVLAGETVDSAYDSSSGLLAQVVMVAPNTNSVIVRQIVGGASNYVINNVSDVGNVKVAIGQTVTNDILAPHLLIMKQDTPKVRVIRLNTTTFQGDTDNEITLAASAAHAYFPAGPSKATCCQGATDWVSLGTQGGLVYYLTSEDLLSTEANKVFLSIDVGRAANASNLVQILGGDVRVLTGEQAVKDKNVCPRQMFFLFATGAVANVCEGNIGGVSVIAGKNATGR